MNFRSMRHAAALLLTAALLAGTGPSARASVFAKVRFSAPVYRSASRDSAHVQAPPGLQVSVTAIRSGCAQVRYKGRVGYMPLSSLTPASRAPGYATCAAAVYSVSGRKLGTVSKGARVCVLGTIDGKYLVASGCGALGLMKPGTLSNQKPQPSAQSPRGPGEKVLRLAGSLLGRSYAVNANPPDSFNCSSFVQYCMAAGGYPMKDTAAEQAADGRYRKIASLSRLRAGDVLCFDTTGNGRVDHTAIYLGSGRFVEASKNAGRVQVNSFTDWYRQHFKWARRPG